MQSLLEFAPTYRDLAPEQFPWIVSTLAVCVGAVYNGGVPIFPRSRGFPYQMADKQYCTRIGGKFREDVTYGRMFACAEKVRGRKHL